MADDAIRNAVQVDDIGFAEFTSKLITSTFDALINANIRQTEAYTELLNEVGKTLTPYINDTKDDVGAEDIRDFLATILPAAKDATEDSAVVKDATLTSDQVATLNSALTVSPSEGAVFNDDKVPADGDLSDPTAWDNLLDAVATRIAANKYTLLEKMVKMGVMRLVVEDGVIETRLKFNAWDYSRNASSSSYYKRKTTNKKRKGGIGFFFGGISAKSKSKEIRVSTAKESSYASQGTSINIFGGVKINFKTDYQPLLED